MDNKEIISTALDNLQINTGIVGVLRDHLPETDGGIDLLFNNKNYFFAIEVKKEVRQHHIAQLTYLKQKLKTKILLVAEYILPVVKTELRELGVPYVEANGNIYIKLNGNIIWVELKKTQKAKVEKKNAFTPTGIQVIFEMLLNPNLPELTQREIAASTKVGLGQINNVIKGLKADGFLINKTKNQLMLSRKEELLETWLIAYNQRLKPKIKIGTYRFVNKEDFQKWKTIKLRKEKTKWGGEPAGNLLTNYLYPQELTIYTTENKKELMQNYKIVPDPKGNVEIYRKFWDIQNDIDTTVPPELIYADLINTLDKRCWETAQIIYEEQIKSRLIQG